MDFAIAHVFDHVIANGRTKLRITERQRHALHGQALVTVMHLPVVMHAHSRHVAPQHWMYGKVMDDTTFPRADFQRANRIGTLVQLQ